MNTDAKPAELQPLAAQLKTCPSWNNPQKRLIEMWDAFREIKLELGDPVMPALLVAMMLYDPTLMVLLLNEVEHAQLQALAKVANERYLQESNPPDKLGKTIAAALKENI